MGQHECSAVAEYMEISPILGEEATKERFLQEISNADILHIGKIAVNFAFTQLTFCPIQLPAVV